LAQSDLEQQQSQNQKRRRHLPQITAAQLLAAERRVNLYFQTAPTNPTDQQLAIATERHREKLATAATAFEEYRRTEQELESASIVDKLLPGYREKSEEAIVLSARFRTAASQMERTQEKLNQLQQQRRSFELWLTSPQTQEMSRLRDYLNTQDTKTRLKKIQAQQAREKALEIAPKRQAQERTPERKPGPELSL
jgi:hypothetical protein